MKTIAKYIDAWLQIIVTVAALLLALVSWSLFPIVYLYIILGVYQPASWLFHFATTHWDNKRRKIYGLLVLLYSISALVLWYSDFNENTKLLLFCTYMILAGLLAIYYLCISVIETFYCEKF